MQQVSAVRTIPDTRGGRLFRRFLLVAGIISIAGIAGQARGLFWLLLSGPSVGGPGAVQRIIMLVGWSIVCWCGVRVLRSNGLPPAWVAYVMPVLIWAYLLWPTG